MPADPLNDPVRLKTLLQWRREGIVTQEGFREAQKLLQPSAAWFAWLRLELALIGVALVLSGIIFFFAWNWQGMGRFEKLGLIQGALLLCVLTALKLGLRELGGRLMMLAAVVMTGVFLAVFGQIYQTGADAYQLFTGWAALTLIWVLVTGFEGLWALWLVILQVGIALFWTQVAGPAWQWTEDAALMSLAAVNLVALFVREWVNPPGGRPWLRTLLVAAVLVLFIIPALTFVFSGAGERVYRVAYLPAWMIITVGGYLYFRFRRPDFTCVALVCANAAVFGVSVIGRGIVEMDDDFAFFLLSIIVVAATAGLTVWLAHEYKSMKHLTR